MGTKNFYIEADFSLRDAENYKTANQKEIEYSTFTKYNVSNSLGFQINPHKSLEASLIYGKATDVGYPDLPMDVSLAEALLGSILYKHQFSRNQFNTQFYVNKITHIMDDYKRPDAPIRMDMPGRSRTWGLNASLESKKQWQLNLNAHSSYSLA